MSKTRIDVIFFDLGGVLINVDMNKLQQAFAQRFDLSVQHIEQIMKQKKSVFDKFSRGIISKNEFINSLMGGLYISFDDFYDLYTSIFTLNQSVAALLLKLSQTHRLSVISNTDELHYKRIYSDYDVMKLFEEPITSFRAHSMKPEKEIYDYALQALNCSPEQTLFIDDKAENVYRARQLGWRGLIYESHKKLMDDLSVMGFFP